MLAYQIAGAAGVQWMKLEEEQYPIWNYGLSSDGSRLFVNTSNYVVKRHTIYVFDTASGNRETFYDFDDPTNVIPGWQAQWAPGDAGADHPHRSRRLLSLASPADCRRAAEQLTTRAVGIESFEVDASRVRSTSSPTSRICPSDSSIACRSTAASTSDSRVAPARTARCIHPTIAMSRTTSRATTHRPDLYVKNLRDKQAEQQVTQSPREDFASYQWGVTSYLEFPSHRDGTKLFGRLTVPVDFDRNKKYPLIVGSVYANTVRNQWGRGVTPAWGLDHTLAGKGYVVLKVNVRGSWGQGRKFASGLIRDYGGIDTDDIESGVRHILAQGYVDPKRVAIWGSSYGGLMTLMSLFKKPGLYAAALPARPRPTWRMPIRRRCG